MRRRDLPGGMVRLEITLHPDEADLVMRALDCARDKKHASEPAGVSAAVPAPTENAARDRDDGRVALDGWPSRAPTDPDVQISRIRLLVLRLRCGSVDAVDDSDWRQRVALQ